MYEQRKPGGHATNHSLQRRQGVRKDGSAWDKRWNANISPPPYSKNARRQQVSTVEQTHAMGTGRVHQSHRQKAPSAVRVKCQTTTREQPKGQTHQNIKLAKVLDTVPQLQKVVLVSDTG